MSPASSPRPSAEPASGPDAPAVPPSGTGSAGGASSAAASTTAPQQRAADGSGHGRTAALITAGRSAQMAVILLLGVLLTHRLTQAEYGTYSQVNVLAAALPLLVTGPASKTLTYFLPRHPAHAPLLRRTAVALLLSGLLLGGAFAFFPEVPALFDRGDAALVRNRAVIGGILFLAFPYLVAESVMIARGAARTYAAFMFAQAGWLLVCVGGSILLADPGTVLDDALVGLLCAYGLQAVLGTFWLFRGDGRPKGEPLPDGVSAFVWPVAGSFALALGANQFDKFVVPWFYPADDNPAVKGTYLRGTMEPPVLAAVAFSMLALTAPRIAALHGRGDRAGILALWRDTCRQIALTSVPATALSVAIAPHLFALVFGEPYAVSARIYAWYAAVLLMRVFLPNVLLESTGAGRSILVSAASQCVLSVVLALALVPVFGVEGAAAAMCLAQFLSNWLVGGALARRHFACSWGDLLDWGFVLRLTLACVAGWSVANAADLAVLASGGGRVLRMLAGAGGFCVAFLAAAWVLRVLRRSDLSALRGLVRR